MRKEICSEWSLSILKSNYTLEKVYLLNPTKDFNYKEIYFFDSDLVWRMQLVIIFGLKFVLCVEEILIINLIWHTKSKSDLFFVEFVF